LRRIGLPVILLSILGCASQHQLQQSQAVVEKTQEEPKTGDANIHLSPGRISPIHRKNLPSSAMPNPLWQAYAANPAHQAIRTLPGTVWRQSTSGALTAL
jgi:hypothetical protein